MPHKHKPIFDDAQSPDAEDFERGKNKIMPHNQGEGIFLTQSITPQPHMVPLPHHTMYAHTHG